MKRSSFGTFELHSSEDFKINRNVTVLYKTTLSFYPKKLRICRSYILNIQDKYENIFYLLLLAFKKLCNQHSSAPF